MKQTKVLVVDDSNIIRDRIISILESDNEIQVMGGVGNGRDAVDMVQKLKPDIVTMDIMMPVMGGIDAIEDIMAQNAVPILVVTDSKDAKIGFDALSKGALEIYPKSKLYKEENWKEFIQKVKLMSRVTVVTHFKRSREKLEKKAKKPVCEKGEYTKVVAIASSTGGPKALAALLSKLPENFPCPVLIAQHMTGKFLHGMVDWLKEVVNVKIKVAEAGEKITPGSVYFSLADQHLEIDHEGKVHYLKRQPHDLYHPSCDLLLSSVADSFGPKSIGIILTGMGNDGAGGMKKIKDAGGVTIAQDENSSIIFGMPKVAIDSGCIDKVLPLDKIAHEVLRIVGHE